MASNMPRTFRRDSKLTYRMYMTMVMLGVLYGVFAVVLNAFGLSVVFIGVIVGLMVFAQYMLSDKLVLWSTGAKEVTQAEEPALHAIVEQLARNAGMTKPKVAVIQSSVPNAFATGRNPKNSLVAVTTGIQKRLSERELAGVLGHELAHVRNRDMRVLAIANFLVTMTSFLMTMLFWNMLLGGGRRDREGSGGSLMLIYLITMVVYFVGQLLVLALTRYREYGADHSGAEISGDPGALASALEKISGAMARIPQEDLRKLQTANAFLLIPAALKGESMVHLFSTHPPVEDRIRRLREMEGEAMFGPR